MRDIERHIKPQNPREKGFSILEVLMAISILAIGILGVASMQIQAGNKNTLAGRATQDMSWATEFAEFILTQPYNSDLLVAGTSTPAQTVDGIDNNSDGRIDEAGESGSISISWVVREDFPIQNTKLIRVTVSQLTQGARQPHSITINQVRSSGI